MKRDIRSVRLTDDERALMLKNIGSYIDRHPADLSTCAEPKNETGVMDRATFWGRLRIFLVGDYVARQNRRKEQGSDTHEHQA